MFLKFCLGDVICGQRFSVFLIQESIFCSMNAWVVFVRRRSKMMFVKFCLGDVICGQVFGFPNPRINFLPFCLVLCPGQMNAADLSIPIQETRPRTYFSGQKVLGIHKRVLPDNSYSPYFHLFLSRAPLERPYSSLMMGK